MTRALSILVSGVVQGVSFRWSTRAEARRLGLVGWVKNRPDGSVEVWAEGDESALQALLAFCREGPPGARVSKVDSTFAEALGRFRAFEIEH